MHYFTVARDLSSNRRARVATLGPSGTSSERAAHEFLSRVRKTEGEVILHDTYREAAATVLDQQSDYLVVANAFHNINTFYMDPALEVHSAFHMYTPLYGLATRPGISLPSRLKIISHPAPVPLIDELMPAGHKCGSVIEANSTSSAAEAVDQGLYDVALTTKTAADKHNLAIISSLRPIEMVWTAFIHSPDATA